jgi:hypothetical protein
VGVTFTQSTFSTDPWRNFFDAFSCTTVLIVTGSWDEASLYASWTGVSSGTSLFRDIVVASAVSASVFQDCVFHGHLLMDSRVGMP